MSASTDMPRPRHLTWDNFRETVLVPGEQRVHRVSTAPVIELFGDSARNMVGIWIAMPTRKELPQLLGKLVSIKATFVERAGVMFLELGTISVPLQRQFYHFAVAVAERMITDRTPAIEAVEAELRCFADLFEEASHLGPERQIGLLGELLFLERLMDLFGDPALDSWLGPLGEPHDFRIEALDIEVKTTVAAHRVHTINGVEQLVPSAGCSLVVASIMLGPAGAGVGFSLASKVVDLETAMKDPGNRLMQFQGKLQAVGFRQDDAQHYSRQFALRRPLALVPVDGSFPAIGRPAIQHILGASASRVESLRYDVDLEGLEIEDGTAAFRSILGAMK